MLGYSVLVSICVFIVICVVDSVVQGGIMSLW